jgi:hypothetical protein
MDPINPSFPEPYTFCNCGKKGCPSLRHTTEGIVIEAPNAEVVSTDDSKGVPFTREQAVELRELLQSRGF